MKKRILSIVALGFLPQLSPVKKLKQKIALKLSQQNNLEFQIARCRLRSLFVLVFYDITVGKPTVHGSVRQLEVKLHVRKSIQLIWSVFFGSSSKYLIQKPAFTLDYIDHLFKILPVRQVKCKLAELTINRSACSSTSNGANKTEIKLNDFCFTFKRPKPVETKFPYSMNLNFEKLKINYKALAENESVIDHLELNIICSVHENTFVISDDSLGKFNSIPFFFYFDYRHAEPDIVQWAFDIPDISFNDILASFPFIVNKELFQIRTEGLLGLWAAMKCNINEPMPHFFDAGLKKQDFKVVSWPARLDVLKGPFIHTVYTSKNEERKISLHEEDGHFVSLDAVSREFLKVIICTEDPSFYLHKGIDIYLLGYSITTNFASKKFLWGGSTITMQLARNLFLNHNKNIFRKIEEVMLTWLMEDIAGLSKERILEIYLNIIEWGPDIYGLKEACAFYFSKHPRELNLTESLVLSYIVPRPKYFVDAARSSSPQLIRNLRNHIKGCASSMVGKGILSREAVKDISYKIKFANQLGEIDLS